MSGLERLLEPSTIAIAGVSDDPGKHGARVLAHLRRLDFPGEIWGVNPRLPAIEGLPVFPTVADLPAPPDLIVAAVPAAVAVETVAAAGGSGGVIVFAAGFAETGEQGGELQRKLVAAAHRVGTRLLGPNSGGVIRPSRGLAATFLTCLDRPRSEIRSGPVGVVTQSGGTGSYLHNLAAARGEGLAVSVATGNEADIRLGEALAEVARLDEVESVLAVVETLRDGAAFMEAVRLAHSLGKRVVACRIGAGLRGGRLMESHTGALALPPALLAGVLESVGVPVAETPAEAFEVASILARLPPAGSRTGIVTHSGGMAILLADLAERHGLDLPDPSPSLQNRLDGWLDHGTAQNPLDLGAIIGGPGRFAAAVSEFARSGEFDAVMAVSTAHPPAHTDLRVAGLFELPADRPVVHLWMAGDQAAQGLAALRKNGSAVTEEPRAAVRAIAALVARTGSELPTPITDTFESWGLPLLEGTVTSDPDRTVTAAEAIGYPVVVKGEASGLAHRTEIGAVEVNLRGPEQVREAFARVADSLREAGYRDTRIRVQPYRPGLEVIVGGFIDGSLGPVVSVGLGGVFAEVVSDITFAPAPIGETGAKAMIERLAGRRLLDAFRGAPPADVDRLAALVSLVSRGMAGRTVVELEMNPVIWDGEDWWAVDWLVRTTSDRRE